MQDDSTELSATSRKSAIGKDIILRETSTTRLLFRPEVVENKNDPKASVRGHFIFQRKKGSSEWEDYKDEDSGLNKLKAGEGIKLELKAAELLALITKLDHYYKIYDLYGIPRGVRSFVVTPQNAKEVILSFLKNAQNFAKLETLKIDDLKKLSVISSINSLKSVLDTWMKNQTNSSEEFWQNFFKHNSWVIAQVFSYPMVLFKEKAYVGGKTIDNTEGNVVDFIYKNSFIESILLVEIKTPTTLLLGKEYRNGIFGWSTDTSGAVSQLLKYKDQIQKDYNSLAYNSNDEQYNLFDPCCMLIVGNAKSELEKKHEKRSFSLLRNDSKNIEIITYDELFEKVKLLIDLLEKN